MIQFGLQRFLGGLAKLSQAKSGTLTYPGPSSKSGSATTGPECFNISTPKSTAQETVPMDEPPNMQPAGLDCDLRGLVSSTHSLLTGLDCDLGGLVSSSAHLSSTARSDEPAELRAPIAEPLLTGLDCDLGGLVSSAAHLSSAAPSVNPAELRAPIAELLLVGLDCDLEGWPPPAGLTVTWEGWSPPPGLRASAQRMSPSLELPTWSAPTLSRSCSGCVSLS